MSNNPLDVPKSKIPVLEPPYLNNGTRTGFLDKLSDQVFFDKPPPPPYSYGPRGILHTPQAQRVSLSPRKEYVDYRLEQLLGPSSPVDLIEDSVDDILLHSMKQSRHDILFFLIIQ